jgi:uncharacterized protein YlxP (DUF503 family)
VAAHVLALTVDLLIVDAQTLKEKRSVVTSILEGARRRFHVAASETGRTESHGRAELAFDSVERFVWSFPEVDVVDVGRDWLEVDAW